MNIESLMDCEPNVIMGEIENEILRRGIPFLPNKLVEPVMDESLLGTFCTIGGLSVITIEEAQILKEAFAQVVLFKEVYVDGVFCKKYYKANEITTEKSVHMENLKDYVDNSNFYRKNREEYFRVKKEYEAVEAQRNEVIKEIVDKINEARTARNKLHLYETYYGACRNLVNSAEEAYALLYKAYPEAKGIFVEEAIQECSN